MSGVVGLNRQDEPEQRCDEDSRALHRHHSFRLGGRRPIFSGQQAARAIDILRNRPVGTGNQDLAIRTLYITEWRAR